MEERESMKALLTGSLLMLGVGSALAQTIEDFENALLDAQTMFRAPRYSGSTSAMLETKWSVGRVTRMPRPLSTLSLAGIQVFEAQFEFKWNREDRWCRLTTFNTPGRPNPYVDVTKKLKVDLWVSAPVRLALGLREVPGVGAIGNNGGTTGPIEWVAPSGLVSNGQAFRPGGLLLTGGQWQTVEIDLAAIPKGVAAPGQVASFVGNGRLDSPGGYVLEHLAFSGEGLHYSVQVMIDRIYQTSPSETSRSDKG